VFTRPVSIDEVADFQGSLVVSGHRNSPDPRVGGSGVGSVDADGVEPAGVTPGDLAGSCRSGRGGRGRGCRGRLDRISAMASAAR
jgi:hypothetical protein